MTKIHMQFSRIAPRLLPRALGVALLATFSASALAGNADLDPTYGGGAFQRQLSAYGNYGFAGALQPDGKLLIGGWAGVSNGTRDFGVIRHLHDTAPDTGFGDGTGKRLIDFLGSHDQVNAMAWTSAGIYAAGYRYVGSYPEFAIAKLTSAGHLDTGFGSGGKATTAFGSYGSIARAMAVQTDGKLLLAGEGLDLTTKNDFTVARFHPDGTLDTSFGTGGKVRIVVSATEHDVAYGMTIQPDGRIVIAGETKVGTQNAIGVVRLLANGTLDSSFGTGGIVRISRSGFYLFGRAVALQPDGRIVVAANATQQTGSVYGTQITQLNADGSLDTGFNTTGYRFDSYAAGGQFRVNAMELLPTGQILIGGQTTITAQNNTMFFSARFTTAGALDTAYNAGTGWKIGDVASSTSYPTSAQFLALWPDGRFYLGGYSNNYFAAARYQGDAVDVAPDAAAFAPATGVAPSTVQTSAAITVSGLTAGAKVPISITGGFYSINGLPGTAQPGYVGNGDVVAVAHTSAATPGTDVTTTLRFGGLSPSNNPGLVFGNQTVASFTSTTQP